MVKESVFLIFNLILFLVLYVSYGKLKKENSAKKIPYYLFPTYTRTNGWVGKLIVIVIDIFLVYSLSSFEFNYVSILSDIALVMVISIMVDWTIYLLGKVFSTIHEYILWKFKDTWYFVFVASCFIILFETLIDFKDYPLIQIIYNMESILILFFGFIYICKLIINIITNKGDVYPERYINGEKDKNVQDRKLDKLLSIISVITIQLIYFTSLICVLVNRNIMQLELNDEPVYKFIDLVYFVIITYTSVGYGDITPTTTIAKIVACVISITGFITSVVVIGELVGMYSQINQNTKNK